MPTPPPRREVVVAGSSSPRHAGGAFGSIEAGGRPSALNLLGGSLQFTRRVRIALPDETRESIRAVSPTDLMRSGLDLLCRSVVLFEQGMHDQDRRVEEVSLLEHRLTEASDNLK